MDIHLKTIIGELAEQQSIDWGMSPAVCHSHPFEIRLKMFSEGNSGKDYFPVILDADGKWMDPADGDISSIPVTGHDVSHIYVYLCDYQKYMDEIKGYRSQDNFRQVLEEQADYSKEVNLIE